MCLGNTCRSPMAEAFANHYGSDVLMAASAGLTPTRSIVRQTVEIMAEMDVDVSQHVPMHYHPVEAAKYDVVVNMSGRRLPGLPPRQLLEWNVQDPVGASPEVYRAVRGDIEARVMRLILDLRRRQT